MRRDLTVKLKKIRLLALDFDGVMTDGFVYVSEFGVETVRCSRRDSMGIALLKRKAGILVCVISGEINPVVAVRCEKLQISCHQGVKYGIDKRTVLEKIAGEAHLSAEEIAYVGDDVNDIEAMLYAGLPIAVADAHPKIKEIAKHITSAKGGDHAVREVCELILAAKNIKSAL